MRKRYQIALAVLLLTIATVSLWRVLPEREPVYQGKRLSVLLADMHKAKLSGNHHPSEVEAIRHIGTNALPMLLAMLRARDTPLKLKMVAWAGKQKLVRVNFKSADQRRYDAMSGSDALGSLALAQVPSLVTTLTNDPSPKVRQAVASALGYIGPEARLAGRALCFAAKDPDHLVRNNCYWALSRVLPDSRETIPTLIAGLDDSFSVARENAAIALGRYGQEANAAVPALLRTLTTNGAAGFNLKRIDPEAAAKAGVH